jgi:virginiamycin B lyase
MAKPPTKEQEALGAFLASINLSGGETWNYELKKLPRPKGKSTRVLVTTYDLPRKDSAPHDTARDADGIVWYSDFQTAVIGRLDPKTGAVKEFPIPLQKPLDKGFPTGSLQIALDQGGNVYAGTMGQSQVVRFDPKTEKIQTWPSPLWDKGDARVTMIDPRFATVNGEIWVNEAGLPPGNIAHKLNINTGEWTRINRQPGGLPVYAYGLVASLKNNLYGLPLFTDDLYEVDAKTLQINHYRIPNAGAGGRRGHIDSKDRLWFAQFMGSSLAMFDPETKGFKTWKIPTPYYNPYDAQFDDKKFAWLSGMNTDSVLRFDVESGEWVEYLMPLTTNMRHIDVQKEGDVSSVWVQDEHNGKIVHVQPLGD